MSDLGFVEDSVWTRTNDSEKGLCLLAMLDNAFVMAMNRCEVVKFAPVLWGGSPLAQLHY